MVKPEATDEEIRAALEAACAWEFVEKLEHGMDTEVRERGTRFSEGQKQRTVHCPCIAGGCAGNDPG